MAQSITFTRGEDEQLCGTTPNPHILILCLLCSCSLSLILFLSLDLSPLPLFHIQVITTWHLKEENIFWRISEKMATGEELYTHTHTHTRRHAGTHTQTHTHTPPPSQSPHHESNLSFLLLSSPY